MSVDKFGHYLNGRRDTDLTKNVPKLLGFFVDTNNNIDVQNKRIKNVANALEENDCINKLFLQAEIEKYQQEITSKLEDLNVHLQDMNKEIINNKSIFEQKTNELREIVNRLDNYAYVSIAGSEPTRIQLTE